MNEIINHPGLFALFIVFLVLIGGILYVAFFSLSRLKKKKKPKSLFDHKGDLIYSPPPTPDLPWSGEENNRPGGKIIHTGPIDPELDHVARESQEKMYKKFGSGQSYTEGSEL